MPALSGVHLVVKGDLLVLTCTDNDLSVRFSLAVGGSQDGVGLGVVGAGEDRFVVVAVGAPVVAALLPEPEAETANADMAVVTWGIAAGTDTPVVADYDGEAEDMGVVMSQF